MHLPPTAAVLFHLPPSAWYCLHTTFPAGMEENEDRNLRWEVYEGIVPEKQAPPGLPGSSQILQNHFHSSGRYNSHYSSNGLIPALYFQVLNKEDERQRSPF